MFVKCCEVFVKYCDNTENKKNKENTVPWTYVMSDLKGQESVETFY